MIDITESVQSRYVLEASQSFQVSRDGQDRLFVEFEAKTAADIFELAFFVDPPGRYLDPSLGASDPWSRNPHFFHFDRVESAGETVAIEVPSEISALLVPDAKVTILSADGFIRVSGSWGALLPRQVSPRPGRYSRIIGLFAFALFLIGIGGIGALFFEPLTELSCERFGVLCSAQHVAFDEAQVCFMQNSACEARTTCGSDFKSRFPTGRFLPRITQLESQAVAACDEQDKLAFSEATACAVTKAAVDACSAGTCFENYLSKFPDGTSVSLAKAEVKRFDADCREMQERTVLNEAIQCANRAPCTAESCFGEYREKYANGSLQNQMEATLVKARQACPPSPPAAPITHPISRPAVEVPSTVAEPPPQLVPAQPSPTPARLIANGVYRAVRGYQGQKSVSDPTNCPRRVEFHVAVHEGEVTFDSEENGANGSFLRRWTGSINQVTGLVVFSGANAAPPTASPLTIVGCLAGRTGSVAPCNTWQYNGAVIESDFCGRGEFQIDRGN